MPKNFLFRILFLVVAGSMVWTAALFGHCEVPCGIYNDKLRVDLLKEHITTIEKSMNEIIELSRAGDKNYNQLVRWIENKDQHANEIQHIVSQYFMTQRIKPPQNDSEKEAYQNKLGLLHEMLIYAMKCKQTTDVGNCAKLNELVDKFSAAYFGAADLEHLKEHDKKDRLG